MNRGYIGMEVEPDLDLGLIRMGARYYAPDLGRWVSPDPLIGQSPGLMFEQVLEANLYAYATNSPIIASDPSGLDAVVLHGGGPGGPDGVRELSRHVRALFVEPIVVSPAGKKIYDPDRIREYRPSIDYENKGFLGWNNVPGEGAKLAEKYVHTAGPKILAGFSMGGDASLRAGGPQGGGKWDLRVISGARVDYEGEDFVSLLEKAARTSDKVVVVALRGDKDMANDSLIPEWLGKKFGDRSYKSTVSAITDRYGSMEAFYKKHSNVTIQAADGAHSGGGNRASTIDAVTRGFKELEGREKAASSSSNEANE